MSLLQIFEKHDVQLGDERNTTEMSDTDTYETAMNCETCHLQMKRQVISNQCEKVLRVWSFVWCIGCCVPTFSSIHNLIEVAQIHVCVDFWFLLPVCLVFCVLANVTLVFYIDRSDVILHYPCITTKVWSSSEDCCPERFQSYRYLEWRYPLPDGPSHGHNIAERKSVV